MAVTIRDVAKAAGVSSSTVSRAMAPDSSISPEIRDRVLEAAESLGYHPNRAAQRLITGRTGAICIIVPDLLNPLYAEVCKGIQARARASGHNVFLADTERDEGLELDAIRTLAPEVDGIILCEPLMDFDDVKRLNLKRPVVLLHRQEDGFSSVTADIGEGMSDVVKHLHALGHRKIAYIGGPRNSWTARQRAVGIRTAAESGVVELVEVGAVAPHFDGGIAAAADVALATEATAIVAFNDIVAFGVISRLMARGVSVPADVSVVGCDDIALSGMAAPPLTTVSVPKAHAARAAVDLLFRALGTPGDEVIERVLPTHLVVRGSTAVPSTAPKS